VLRHSKIQLDQHAVRISQEYSLHPIRRILAGVRSDAPLGYSAPRGIEAAYEKRNVVERACAFRPTLPGIARIDQMHERPSASVRPRTGEFKVGPRADLKAEYRSKNRIVIST
jgi:hypothetical protein